MRFEDIKGNDDVKKALTGMVAGGRIPHAIMFHEDDGGGAIAFCLAFLQLLIPSERVSRMTHLDVHYSFPINGEMTDQYLQSWREMVLSNPYFTEKQFSRTLGIEGKNTLIAVQEAKSILDKLSFNAVEGGYRAIVIYLPEKMNAEAANKLLKAIEEPSAKTQFLLVTHSPEKVLPTISSRCQNIRIMPVASTASVKADDDAEDETFFRMLMDALVSRDLSSALEVAEALSARTDREKAKGFCKFASGRLRQIFLFQQGLEDIATADGSSSELALTVKKTFPRRALDILSRANVLVERNVNLKILFTDMVDKLYTSM